MKRETVFTIMFVMLTLSVFSSGVKKKEVKHFNDFISGKLKGTAISKREKLVLGVKIDNISAPEEEYILSADVSPNGDIYVGTGHSGNVYKVGNNGKTEKVFSAKEPDVYAILVSGDKSVYFATSPRGKVYKRDPKGKISEFFNPDEKYIWDLKEDKAGRIICAVGGSGAVYSIDPKGNSKTLFIANDTHILSLYISSDNRIFAGSAPKGMLYEVKNGKMSILDDTPKSEVRSICGDKKGNIFYVSSKSEKEKIFPVFNDNKKLSSQLDSKVANTKSSAYIYRLSSNGNIDLIWISNRYNFGSIYSIIYDEKNRAVLAGSSKGKLFSIKNLTDFSLVYEGDSEVLYKLIQQDRKFFMIFNNTPRLAKGSYARKNNGIYISEVFDMNSYSMIGKLYWTCGRDSFKGTTFFIRSGNTASPDNSWTDWSAPIDGKSGMNMEINGYRFVQIKIALHASELNSSPSVEDFRFYYVQKNIKPIVMNINVDTQYKDKKMKKSDDQVIKNSSEIKVSWIAHDSNEDNLEYSLYMKKKRGKRWIKLVEKTKKESFKFNKELYEDGVYKIKVVVDDLLSNSPGNYKKEHLISETFTLDSTPPVLSLFKTDGDVVTFNVSDNISVISGVFYSSDGKRWDPLFPVDKISDSLSEQYRIKKSTIKNPGGVVFFKVVDENMNFRIYQKEL